MPSFRRPPGIGVAMWSGGTLPAEMASPSQYVRCRPCTCGRDGRIVPWDDWHTINRAAYARLRRAWAPYPVAIVTGFHGLGVIGRYRIELALRLLAQRWVAALVFTGGHRRASTSEVEWMLGQARRRAAELGIDVRDRIFVEPCATRSITNLRNTMRMMAALGIPNGLLVSDSKVSGQAAVWSSDLDALVERQLGCPVGRITHLLGSTPLWRVGLGNGCRAPFGTRHNPAIMMLPRREPVIFWASPFTPTAGRTMSALECGAGSAEVRAIEPDDRDPFTSSCLPALGRRGMSCNR